LSTEILEDGAILRVEDQGPGIPQELHQRVFERFYRELGTGQTGTGLGLSIVSTICQLHRARVKLTQGENGYGLIVTIHFRNSLWSSTYERNIKKNLFKT
jgi:signal transduction histidine kinase